MTKELNGEGNNILNKGLVLPMISQSVNAINNFHNLHTALGLVVDHML